VHLSDAQAAALIHGQLDSEGRATVGAHLAECATCADRVRDLELADRQVAALLRRLDVPAPSREFAQRRELSRAPAPGARASRPHPSDAHRGSLRARRVGSLAAGIALACVAAAAAAAVPGSPVRRILDRAAVAIGARRDAPAPPPRPAPPPAQGGGVAITPGREIEVHFRRPQRRGTVRIAFDDRAAASLRATSGTPGYAVGEDRIVVDNAGDDATYELTVPRALDEVRVRVADVVVFHKAGGRVIGHPPSDSAGGYTVRLDPGVRRAP